MKEVAITIVFGIILLGCFLIGSGLVLKGHPWFGLLVFLITACIRIKT